MPTGLSAESANWILPSHSTNTQMTNTSYEQPIPFRVNPEGVKNYMKNRGTLNIGEWATESRQTPKSANVNYSSEESYGNQPKVIGPDAIRNMNRDRGSTPNLMSGPVEMPASHNNMRVKREGLAYYERNHNSELKDLLSNYGRSASATKPIPHTQGETATNLFYSHQEGQMGSILNQYGRSAPSPRPIPHVKGEAAEMNLQRGHGDSQLLEYVKEERMRTPDPHLKGSQAHFNYEMSQGQNVDELFHQYGKLPLSTQAAPKVKLDGLQYRMRGQGDEMRKTLNQCPPTARFHQ